jgi:hypothetical protein
MESNIKKDMAVEREIAAFLDKNLYLSSGLFSEHVRTDDIDSQKKGSDIILSTCDGKLHSVVVDEKAAAKYANRRLNTFALELSYIGMYDKKKDGWFLDKSKVTQYYLLVWIVKADIRYDESTKEFDTDSITRDNIRELDWCLVSRDSIIKFLENKGWNLEELAKHNDMIREQGGVETKKFVNDVLFWYSDNYPEKPINILLKKQTYIGLSEYHGKIIV